MAIVKNNSQKNNPQDENAPGPSKKEEKRYITIRNLEALGMDFAASLISVSVLAVITPREVLSSVADVGRIVGSVFLECYFLFPVLNPIWDENISYGKDLETEPPAPAPFEYGAWYVRPPHWERRDGYYQSLAKLHSSPPQDRIRHY